jgi:ubiquinone/menaquinone biosynthesis C-methylase UbiE
MILDLFSFTFIFQFPLLLFLPLGGDRGGWVGVRSLAGRKNTINKHLFKTQQIQYKPYLQDMKSVLIFAVNLLLIVSSSFAQQNEEKVKKIKFCGYKYKDSTLLRKHFEQQLAFLQINDGDTIVDIGSSSGAYIGAINVIADFKKVHFILVDIDSNCLNSTKVNNMIAHYEELRGQPFNNTIGFVLNTIDSLWLPLNSKKKLWIFNTLHEIPGKAGMIKQMSAVLQSGGEIIIAELLATEKNKIHGGCKDPLMSDDEIKNLMDAAGFDFKNAIINPIPVKKMKNPYCLYRFIKR